MSAQTATAILLVEDNPADIHLIQKALYESGHDIHLAIVPNGRDALSFLRKEGVYALELSPALILLDLSLPYLHGEVVLEQLRDMPAYADTPVVVFSGAPQELEEQRCRRLGANAYVQKPTELAAFFAAINTLVEMWL
jgi:CheY-like chemotaxis protein